GGPYRRVEHRHVAGSPQRGEAEALDAAGFFGNDGRVIGVRIAAGEADRPESGHHEVEARTSTGLQVKGSSLLSALRASAHRCCRLFARALIAVVCSSRERSSLPAGANAEKHVLPRGDVRLTLAGPRRLR